MNFEQMYRAGLIDINGNAIPATRSNKMITEDTDAPVRYSRGIRPDAQAFDEIRIKTVPRYKESELSGDEWRISALVEFVRKGKVLHTESYGTIEYAAKYLPVALDRASEKSGYRAGEEDYCDQEGCSDRGVVAYKIKDEYCRGGHKEEKIEGINPRYRMFCERHRSRGDCGLEDADCNYEEIPLSEVTGKVTEDKDRLNKKYEGGGYSYLYWPVQIDGENLHITAKFLGKEKVTVEEIRKDLDGKNRDVDVWGLEWTPVVFDTKNDGKVKVLQFTEFPNSMKEVHDALAKYKKDDYPDYKPHVTVSDKLWDKVKENSYSPDDMGITIGKLMFKVDGVEYAV